MKQDFQMIEIGFPSKVSCKEMNLFPFLFQIKICDIFFPILKMQHYVLDYRNISLLLKKVVYSNFKLFTMRYWVGFFINITVKMAMTTGMGTISSFVEKCCQEMWNIYKHTTITSCINNLSSLKKTHNCSNDFHQYVFNSDLKYKCITIHT
jgi:hypothetical protein